MRQKEALDIMKLGHNVYLTGAAGSGKTYTLNQYIDYLRKHGVPVGVTASTGIAATHLGGMTIHSWAGIGIETEMSEDELKKLAKKSYLKKRITNTHVLVIDEVSMLDAKRLDLVDRVCKLFRDPFQPFGGIQIILAGDFFQLPPVSKRGEETATFVTESAAWEDADLRVCYLSEQHRQGDDAFLSVLNAIRDEAVDEEMKDHLRGRYRKPITLGIDEPTKLYTHNVDVDVVNERALERLDGEVHTYHMKQEGRPTLARSLVQGCMAPEELRLKQDATVMFVKNHVDGEYVNGTLGMVVDFDPDTDLPVVETIDGEEVYVQPAYWTIEEDGETLASIKQLPLRLAWAITVHKSQGMSLDAAEVDLSKSFSPGMGYVALSRVKTLEGLSLLGLGRQALEVHPHVREMDTSLREKSDDHREYVRGIDDAEKKKYQQEFVTARGTAKREKKPKISTYAATKDLLAEGQSIDDVAKARELKPETILRHMEVLKERGELPSIAHLKPSKKLLTAVAKARDESSDGKLAPMHRALKGEYTYNEIRLALLFL